jgi:hypothetical protein
MARTIQAMTTERSRRKAFSVPIDPSYRESSGDSITVPV